MPTTGNLRSGGNVPAYHAVAELQEEKGAVRSTIMLEAEKIHAEWYANAKKVVETKQDITIGTIQICEVCGYTAEGEAPEKCPVCSAPRTRLLRSKNRHRHKRRQYTVSCWIGSTYCQKGEATSPFFRYEIMVN